MPPRVCLWRVAVPNPWLNLTSAPPRVNLTAIKLYSENWPKSVSSMRGKLWNHWRSLTDSFLSESVVMVLCTVQGVDPYHNKIALVPGEYHRLPNSGTTGSPGLAACWCSGPLHHGSYLQNYRTYVFPGFKFNALSTVAGMSIRPRPCLGG